MTATSISQLFYEYINYNYLLGSLFLLAIGFYVGKAAHKDRLLGKAASISVIFPFLTLFNPLLFTRLAKIADGGASYYRFIWAFPLVTLCAGFLSELVFKPFDSAHSKKLRALLISGTTALLLCSAILFSGTSYLTKKNLTIPENKFNISRATLDISQFIQDDPDHTDGDVVLAPTEIMMELLAFDSTIVSALPRDEYINYKKVDSVYQPLLSLILEGPESTWHHFENVRYNCKALNVEYIVTLTLFDLDRYMDFLDKYTGAENQLWSVEKIR